MANTEEFVPLLGPIRLTPCPIVSQTSPPNTPLETLEDFQNFLNMTQESASLSYQPSNLSTCIIIIFIIYFWPVNVKFH